MRGCSPISTGCGPAENHCPHADAAGSIKRPIVAGAAYIAAITETSIDQVNTVLQRRQWRLYRDEHPGPCSLGVPITATVDGAPWIDTIDYYEVETLTRHLRTAAFVVTAYLTGMRASEVLALEVGCCLDSQESDEPGRSARRHRIGMSTAAGLPR
jgi:integrase